MEIYPDKISILTHLVDYGHHEMLLPKKRMHMLKNLDRYLMITIVPKYPHIILHI